MAVTNRPVNGRLRITYMGDLYDMRVGHITPWASANDVNRLVRAFNSLQSATTDDVYLTVESLLTE